MEGTPSRWAEFYRRGAGILLALLLAAYIVFNKPFALLGWPPLYIGEIVLALALPALLLNFNSDIAEPIRRTWGLSLIGAYFVYGTVRIGMSVPTYGLLPAAHDGVIVLYALLALLAPALWRRQRTNDDLPRLRPAPGLAGRVWLALIPVALLSLAWACETLFGHLNQALPPWNNNKPDFTTLAAAVGAWTLFVSALRLMPFREGIQRRWLHALVALPCLGAAGAGAYLVMKLPTRAVWVSALPLAGLCLLVLPAGKAAQRAAAMLVSTAALAALVFAGARVNGYARQFGSEYKLDRELDWSIADLEQQLRSFPETYGKYDPHLNLTNLDPQARRERFNSLLQPDEARFSTQAGQRGADADKWRLIFWQRAVNYTKFHAPWTGIGFGPNITNLNRHTPAWPMFQPAMSLGNRSPHSAHLSVYVRMGLIGLALWLCVLASTALSTIGALWYCRAGSADTGATPEFRALHRTRFFGLLAVFGVWLIYVCAMSFSVTLENPMGGMPFWALTGVLLIASRRTCPAPSAS